MQVSVTHGYGDDETTETVEIPDAVIEQAQKAAYDEDRPMVVGLHPYFGWVYRDAEDDAGISELGTTWICDGGEVREGQF